MEQLTEDDPLEQVIQQAEEKSEEAKKQIEEAEKKLQGEIGQLYEEDIITGGQLQGLEELIREHKFQECREQIERIKEENKLDFEDEEKDQFAQAFQEAFEDLKTTMEDMKDTPNNLENGTDRKDLVSYLRGNKSKRTKKEVTQVFDALDNMTSSGNSTKDLARALSGFKSDLTMTQAEEILEEIEEKVKQ